MVSLVSVCVQPSAESSQESLCMLRFSCRLILIQYGNPSKDITAYIARCSRCTELCNGCGMAPLLVDAMMGHAPPRGDKANWDNYLRQPNNWPAAAQMTERIKNRIQEALFSNLSTPTEDVLCPQGSRDFMLSTSQHPARKMQNKSGTRMEQTIPP